MGQACSGLLSLKTGRTGVGGEISNGPFAEVIASNWVAPF
jgi:hypothetical protein